MPLALTVAFLRVLTLPVCTAVNSIERTSSYHSNIAKKRNFLVHFNKFVLHAGHCDSDSKLHFMSSNRVSFFFFSFEMFVMKFL